MKKSVSAGLVSDVLGLMGVPTNTLASVYEEVRERRRKEALEILLSEIRKGDFQKVNEFEAVSIIERYMRDAMEGTARNNLKIMAQVIRGMSASDSLQSSLFLRYASILASLSAEEIQVLGIIARQNERCYESAKAALLTVFSEEHCKQILQSLIRTGLVCFTQGLESEYNEREPDMERENTTDTIKWIENDFWTNYEFTPLMDEILKYTAFYGEGDIE